MTPAPRTPPHSIDAEESLLACLLIDGADTLAAANDAGITAASFYEPANRLLFEIAAELLSAGHPGDEATVAEELRKRGQLDAVGGLVRLNQITNRIPTTAHRAYFVEQLVAAEACRRVITAATAAQEAAHKFAGSPEDLANALAAAVAPLTGQNQASRSLARAAEDEAQAVADEIAGKRQRGTVASTIPTLDRNAGLLALGELVILAGRPGTGKTSLALQIAAAAAVQPGAVLVFSHEMSRAELLRVVAAQCSGISGRGLERAQPHDQRAYLDTLRALGRSLPGLRVFDAEADVNTIAARCRSEAVRGTVSLVVVDYLQLVQPPRELRAAIREQQVATITRTFKRLAGQVGAPVLLLSQLNRAGEADGRAPRLSDLRESGAIEQDANRVLLLHRPETGADGRPQDEGGDSVDVRAHLAKHRSGPTGAVWLRFTRPTQSFREVGVPTPATPASHRAGRDD